MPAGRRLERFRGWTLAPLGAVIAVAIVVGLVYVVLVRGGSHNEAKARDYFTTQAGGSATQEEARQINVQDCRVTFRRSVHGNPLVECALHFHGQPYTACFESDGDSIIDGRPETGAAPGCDQLRWVERVHALVRVAGG